MLNEGYGGPQRIATNAAFRKGEEMGHFQHGSTMLVFATEGVELCDTLREGSIIRTGEPLLRYREEPHVSVSCRRST